MLAEEMFDAGIPWVAVDPKGDWWGVRAQSTVAKGMPVAVFGGRHGDIAITATAGARMADLVLAERLTCVLDVSEFSKADQIRFLTDFAERLYRQATDEPLHLFLEEAHEYLPQRVQAREAQLVGAMQKIVKQGRFKGLGCTLVTQRSASLNKDVLTQADILIALRTTSPQDRAAVKAWVETHDASDEMMAELPSLPSGVAWVWSPDSEEPLSKVCFRRRRTFDSGSTPKIGQARRAPATMATIDMRAIALALQDVAEQAEATDPKVLQRRIRELERQVQEAGVQQTIEVERIVERRVEVIPQEVFEALRTVQRSIDDAVAALTQKGEALRSDVATAVERGKMAIAPARAAVDRPLQRSGGFALEDGSISLKAGARRMLSVLAKRSMMRMSESQVALLSKMKRTSGTFSNYKSSLVTQGLVEIDGDKQWRVTERGLEVAGEEAQAPLSNDELIAEWRSNLKAGAARMFDALLGNSGEWQTREWLGAQTGISSSSGTFSNYLSTLRTNGLIEQDGQLLRINPDLFS